MFIEIISKWADYIFYANFEKKSWNQIDSAHLDL